MKINRGTIKGFSGSAHSGIAFLFVEDVIQGIMPIPCDNGTTIKALEKSFGNIMSQANTVDDIHGNHIGQEVYWSYDKEGARLKGFTPVAEAGKDLLEAYYNGLKCKV